MGQRDDRPVVASALVAAFFVALTASCLPLMQPEWLQHPDIWRNTVLLQPPGLGVRSVVAIATQLSSDRPPLRRRPHAGDGMLHLMQLRALSTTTVTCADGHGWPHPAGLYASDLLAGHGSAGLPSNFRHRRSGSVVGTSVGLAQDKQGARRSRTSRIRVRCVMGSVRQELAAQLLVVCGGECQFERWYWRP
jgi:hypothetical protein